MNSSINRISVAGAGSASGDIVARGANGSIDVPAGGSFTVNGSLAVNDAAVAIKEAAAPSAAADKVVLYFDSADGSLKAKVENGDVHALVTYKI